MIIRLLTGIVGDRFSYRAGDEIDVPDDLAERLIAKKQAEAVTRKKVAAKAVSKPVKKTKKRK
tara:strand:- start:4749 stop:4937 length:189 start_codon:yes stop_codon:yes gene_type:complete